MMLEFLKGYDKNSIYERAKDAELTLRAFDAITFMASFTEAVLKTAYSACFPGDPEVSRMKLSDLLTDLDLLDYLKKEYCLSQNTIDVLDRKIRRSSNRHKHDLSATAQTEEEVKTCFRAVYELASGFYRMESGNTAPAWDDGAYQVLYNDAIDADAREKLKEESNKTIEELNRKLAELQREKSTANQEIENLTVELRHAKEAQEAVPDIENLNSRISALESQIDEAEGQQVLLREDLRNAIQEKLTLEQELINLRRVYVSEKDEQAQATAARIEKLNAELESVQEKAEDLKSKNASLQQEVQNLLVEKQSADRRLSELELLLEKSESVEDLERRLRVAEAKKLEIIAELETQQQKLEEVEKRYKAQKSALAALDAKYQAGQQFLAEHARKCKKCNAPMSFAKSKKHATGYYWKCPNFPDLCEGCGTPDVTPEEEETIIRPYFEISGVNQYGRIVLSPEEQEQFSTPEVEFGSYPDTLNEIDPDTFLFQSITVPEKVFLNRMHNGVADYSKFTVAINLDKGPVPEKNKAVYTLALRLLNRGVVLKESQETEQALREKFNKNDLGSVNRLFDTTSYGSPCCVYDSERERHFAEYYFPKVLGPSWASYVFSQASFDMLIEDPKEWFRDQRVDFSVIWHGRKLVVELDGPEHADKVDADSFRDNMLRSNGFTVLRFPNSEVDARSEKILQQLTEVLCCEENERIDADVDTRYMVASKLCHQFAVTIVKCLEQGSIQERANLKAEISSNLFTQSEVQFILRVAVAEVYSIVRNFSILYGIEASPEFFDSTLPETLLSAGDGRITQRQSVMIRDCTLPVNVQCDLADFPEELQVVNPDEEALKFFLNYIFGFPNFQQGQYSAIRRLLEKQDSIVLLPTGSGKSLIYQLSSFLVPGIVVVVAPLVSLIEDQVQNLERKHGITSAIYFVSTATKEDKKMRVKSRRLMQHNTTTMVYIAPERLIIPSFRGDVEKLLRHNTVYAVAIDEAHCVSEWGHDFRPAYLNVGTASRQVFKKHVKQHDVVPVISALTGTASDAVLNDVRLVLGIRGREALVQPDSFDRQELHFTVRVCGAKSKDINLANIIRNDLPAAFGVDEEVFSRLQGADTYSGIVFTPLATREDSQYAALTVRNRLESMLPEFGISEYYSGAPENYTDAAWKTVIRDNARRYKDDELNLLVATKAFGMGIDKPNIRFIIHDGFPQSFEQYYQEAGRAGRDHERAECILLFSNDNEEENEKLLNPNLELDKFKEEYEPYQKAVLAEDRADDVSSLLYFHNSSFSGIEAETIEACDLLDRISAKGFEENKIAVVRIPDKIAVETEYGTEYVRVGKDDQEKKWLQALVRLQVLGLVKDYTYDYGGTFRITCGILDKDQISEKYAAYVTANVPDEGLLRDAKDEFKDLPDSGIELAKAAVKVLVTYVYNHIELSRRRAIFNIYDAVKQAAAVKGEEQNRILRGKIADYFVFKGENRDELKVVEESRFGAGLLEAVKLFELSPERERFTKEETEHAGEIYVLAGRLLESKPDHPGLLLTQALGRLISGDSNERAIVFNIEAAIRYAVEKYRVDSVTMANSFYPALNTVLSFSPALFDTVAEKYSSLVEAPAIKLMAGMAQSDLVSDSNREYLLACFANLLLENSLGGKKT